MIGPVLSVFALYRFLKYKFRIFRNESKLQCPTQFQKKKHATEQRRKRNDVFTLLFARKALQEKALESNSLFPSSRRIRIITCLFSLKPGKNQKEALASATTAEKQFLEERNARPSVRQFTVHTRTSSSHHIFAHKNRPTALFTPYSSMSTNSNNNSNKALSWQQARENFGTAVTSTVEELLQMGLSRERATGVVLRHILLHGGHETTNTTTTLDDENVSKYIHTRMNGESLLRFCLMKKKPSLFLDTMVGGLSCERHDWRRRQWDCPDVSIFTCFRLG